MLFFLALFIPWANAIGAWLGLLSSIATAVTIAYAPDFGIDLGVSFVWMMPCSLLVGVTVGVLGSAIGGIPQQNLVATWEKCHEKPYRRTLALADR